MPVMKAQNEPIKECFLILKNIEKDVEGKLPASTSRKEASYGRRKPSETEFTTRRLGPEASTGVVMEV